MRAELRDDDPRRVAPAASFAPKSRRESRFTRFRAHGALVWFACRGEGPDAHLANGTDCRRFVPPHPQRR